MSPSILAISYFFHLLATIVWIGGLVLLVVLVLPEARRVLGTNREFYALLTRLRRRFMPMTNLSLAVLVVTGLVQMAGDSHYDGVLQFTNEWSRVILLKHVAVAGMFICGLALQYWVAPALERASLLVEKAKGDPAELDQLQKREARLTWVNVGLGVLVLGFTAWATAL
ncbi:MAG: CopD family protein [Anaerolineae bacterium]|nr:CopD family protein [Anaerolineae bacterium]